MSMNSDSSCDPSPSAVVPQVADRAAGISPFLVMDVMRAANARQQRLGDVIHMEVGQPAVGAPTSVLAAAHEALRSQRLGYTEALGLPALRARIAQHYADYYGVAVEAGQVVVTTGSSAGFILAFLAAFNPGDRIATPTPGYPCYRNILKALGLTASLMTLEPADRYQPSVAALEAEHGRPAGLRGFLLASPANPTGTMISASRLQALGEACRRLGLWMISDEIYHGLTYDQPAMTALAFNRDAIVINSFSKYYAMTGWRIGWMVVPDRLVRPIERLAQNLFIAPPSLSQYAALAAFDAVPELEKIKAGYQQNREILLRGLQALGITEIFPADGAFYVYAKVAHLHHDSAVLAQEILRRTGVAVTPGTDFDPFEGHAYLRFCYAGEQAEMRMAMQRLQDWLPTAVIDKDKEGQ